MKIVEQFRNPTGRTEKFMRIQVFLSDEELEFSTSALDRTGRKRLKKHLGGNAFQAYKGIAKISWRSTDCRQQCFEDHRTEESRRQRWNDIVKYGERILAGDHPSHGHVYLHPDLTGEPGLTVIDGTRRMVASLEAGLVELPVVIINLLPCQKVDN